MGVILKNQSVFSNYIKNEPPIFEGSECFYCFENGNLFNYSNQCEDVENSGTVETHDILFTGMNGIETNCIDTQQNITLISVADSTMNQGITQRPVISNFFGGLALFNNQAWINSANDFTDWGIVFNSQGITFRFLTINGTAAKFGVIDAGNLNRGVKEITITSSRPLSTSKLCIGKNADSDYGTTASIKIYHASIWKKAMSDEEILSMYNRLKAYYNSFGVTLY